MRPVAFLPLLSFLAGCSSAPPPRVTAPEIPTTPREWALVWSDEFDGPAGTRVDSTKWVTEIGGQGWGNQERQYYTTSAENAALDGQGHLVLTARAEPAGTALQCWYGACRYTSARLKTMGKFEQTYGRFEARLRVPRGQGIWPAFWMLGNDIDRVGWPRSGEIDIMEHIGREPNFVYGTVHGPGYSGGSGISGRYSFASDVAEEFHVFAVEWVPGEINWFVDGRQYHRVTPQSLPAGGTWVFDHPFFLLLNLAVGGAWPGDPDASTAMPQRLTVDYVRVYRR